MALRNKLRIPVQLYETANSNRIKTGAGLNASIYPAGMEIEQTKTITVGVSDTVEVSGRGSLAPSSTVWVVDSAGTEVYTGTITLDAIEEKATDEGTFVATITSSTEDINLQPGYRIVAARVAANLVTLYEDESADDELASYNPYEVPANGLIEAYVEVDGVDVYLSGSGIVAQWYGFNLPASSGVFGPIHLRGSTLTEAATLEIDALDSVAYINAGSGPITSIEHCTPGKLLVLIPLASGIQLTTVNSEADNTIFEASGRTISLAEGVPLLLVGVDGGADIAYWTVLGSASSASDTALDDLTDVNVGTPVANQPLVYDGSSWAEGSALGNSANPITGLVVLDNGFYIQSNTFGGEARIIYSGIGALDVTIPPGSGGSLTLMTLDTSQTVTGEKQFPADNFVVTDPSVPDKKAKFNVSNVALGTTRVLSVPNKDIVIADANDVPTQTGDLSDFQSGAADGDIPIYSLGAGAYVPEARGHKHVVVSFNLGSGTTGDFGILDKLLASGSGWNAIDLLRADRDIRITRVMAAMWTHTSLSGGGDCEFQLYHHTSRYTGTAIPPASGTAILTGTMAVPGTNSTYVLDTTTLSDATVPSGSYVFLALAAGTTEPSSPRGLELVIEYTEDV